VYLLQSIFHFLYQSCFSLGGFHELDVFLDFFLVKIILFYFHSHKTLSSAFVQKIAIHYYRNWLIKRESKQNFWETQAILKWQIHWKYIHFNLYINYNQTSISILVVKVPQTCMLNSPHEQEALAVRPTDQSVSLDVNLWFYTFNFRNIYQNFLELLFVKEMNSKANMVWLHLSSP
jgi:hypothetical protein